MVYEYNVRSLQLSDVKPLANHIEDLEIRVQKLESFIDLMMLQNKELTASFEKTNKVTLASEGGWTVTQNLEEVEAP